MINSTLPMPCKPHADTGATLFSYVQAFFTVSFVRWLEEHSYKPDESWAAPCEEYALPSLWVAWAFPRRYDVSVWPTRVEKLHVGLATTCRCFWDLDRNATEREASRQLALLREDGGSGARFGRPGAFFSFKRVPRSASGWARDWRRRNFASSSPAK